MQILFISGWWGGLSQKGERKNEENCIKNGLKYLKIASFCVITFNKFFPGAPAHSPPQLYTPVYIWLLSTLIVGILSYIYLESPKFRVMNTFLLKRLLTFVQFLGSCMHFVHMKVLLNQSSEIKITSDPYYGHL